MASVRREDISVIGEVTLSTLELIDLQSEQQISSTMKNIRREAVAKISYNVKYEPQDSDNNINMTKLTVNGVALAQSIMQSNKKTTSIPKQSQQEDFRAPSRKSSEAFSNQGVPPPKLRSCMKSLILLPQFNNED